MPFSRYRRSSPGLKIQVDEIRVEKMRLRPHLAGGAESPPPNRSVAEEFKDIVVGKLDSLVA